MLRQMMLRQMMLRQMMMGATAMALSVTALSGAANAKIFKFVANLSVLNEIGSPATLTGTGKGVMLYDDRGTMGSIGDDLYNIRIDFGAPDYVPLGSSVPVPNNATPDPNDFLTNPVVQITSGHNHLGVRGTNGSPILHLDTVDSVAPPNETPLVTNGFVPVVVLNGDGSNLLCKLSEPAEQGTPPAGAFTVPCGGLRSEYTDADVIANLLAYAYGTNDDSRALNADGTMDTNWYVNLHTTLSDGFSLSNGHIRDQWRFEIPEPATMTLLGAGLMGLTYFGKRRRA